MVVVNMYLLSPFDTGTSSKIVFQDESKTDIATLTQTDVANIKNLEAYGTYNSTLVKPPYPYLFAHTR